MFPASTGYGNTRLRPLIGRPFATGKEASEWHQVLIVHDGTTGASQGYLVEGGAWRPVGPAHRIAMNHSHLELKVDVSVPGVRVTVDFDDVRLHPSPERHPVTVVVDSPLNEKRDRPAYAIERLEVKLVEPESQAILGTGVTDEGGQAQVTLRSDVIYPVAAMIEVSDGAGLFVTAAIPREGVRGLYPSDVWVVGLPERPRSP
jgi:hypothetical protein